VKTEDTFTAPHAECEHPELWHSADSDSTEIEVSELIGALVRALQPEWVVETGTAFGYTTAMIARALWANGHGHLYTLDIDHERIERARQNVREHSPYNSEIAVTFVQQSSMGWEPPCDRFDFTFFDSVYELRAEEFLRFRAMGKLLPGSIVAFHDTTSAARGHHWDMRADVQQLARDGLLVPIFLRTPRGIAICEVL
jgi:predicted O-methyltransferase YrrM